MTGARPRALAPLVIVALLFGLALYARPTLPFGRPPAPFVGKPVPAFDLPGYDAVHPGLSDRDLRQGTATVLNVFASWCLPCRIESPQLAAIADTGVVVHGLAFKDRADGLAVYFRNYGIPFRRVGIDSDGRASAALGIEGIPISYVIDGRGMVTYVHHGVIGRDDVPAILRHVDVASRRNP